eukprot:CAMPEP_0184714680 /NCGR_PEP_ID=MMETSP0314-20130426/4761_1 /TAXON_ID=38298 /ORGANISM="Rhodella maculata, Strain CCMP 736" /LENGTH=95 /DNA_ID=CAMNT_0027177645 /DNA_START=129 /DNA_END=416 /DNA_ORIENTATION=-
MPCKSRPIQIPKTRSPSSFVSMVSPRPFRRSSCPELNTPASVWYPMVPTRHVKVVVCPGSGTSYQVVKYSAVGMVSRKSTLTPILERLVEEEVNG